MKLYTNELGHITNMATIPIYGKNLKTSSKLINLSEYQRSRSFVDLDQRSLRFQC